MRSGRDSLSTGIHLAFAIIVICGLSGSANGQDLPEDRDICRCPNVTMWTDSYEAREGEMKVFRIEFENPEHEKCDIKIGWIVTSGEIVDGQGTREMRLRIPDNAAGTSIQVVADMNQGELTCENHPHEVIKIVSE